MSSSVRSVENARWRPTGNLLKDHGLQAGMERNVCAATHVRGGRDTVQMQSSSLGQECPSHTGRADFLSDLSYSNLWVATWRWASKRDLPARIKRSASHNQDSGKKVCQHKQGFGTRTRSFIRSTSGLFTTARATETAISWDLRRGSITCRTSASMPSG